MATALPPEVDGPITPATKQVFVDNVLPQSIVTVYADGAQVGQVTSTNPGWIFVPLTATLLLNQEITAKQNYTGSDPDIPVTSGNSDASNSVEVQAVPVPLPPLVFLSGLSTCMGSVLMGGLIPGTSVSIHLGSPGGPLLVNNALSQPPGTPPTQWFGLVPMAIMEGSTLYAQQTLGPTPSEMTPSPPVAGPPSSLGVPEITTPVRPCQMALELANLTPGANLQITNNAAVIAMATVPWSAYTFAPLLPLVAGTLSVKQYFLRCEEVPPASSRTVPVAASPLPTPSVAYGLCIDVKQLSVSNLLAGEVLVLERVVQTSPTTHTSSVIGAQGVSKSTATVFLPNDFEPTDRGGPVSVWINVSLCAQNLPPVVVPIAAVASYPAPTVPPPLYACALSVLVQGAHPGSIIQIFSGSPPVPRSNPVVAATADLVVELWTPLVATESIFARQTGCGANGVSPNAGVLGLPMPLTTPQIDYLQHPVRPGATQVFVTSLLPGAQVYLSVEGVLRTVLDATETSMWMPTGAPLEADQELKVFQTLCTEISGTYTIAATIGQLNVVYSPPTLVRGKANALTVSANDADVPGPPTLWVPGLPVMVSKNFTIAGVPLGPSVSGVTGRNLLYTPGAHDAAAVAFVFGAPGYENAHNEIALVDPLSVWVEDVGTSSAVVYGSGFGGPAQKVIVAASGLVPQQTFVGDIASGITVHIECTGTPGETWSFTAQSTSGGPIVSGTISCP
jgi:hypothetical protein